MSVRPPWLTRLLDRTADQGGPGTRSLVALASAITDIKNPKVMTALAPSAVRGFLLRRGKTQEQARIRSSHAAVLDWSYPREEPVLARLYTKALKNQWIGDELPWATSVDLQSTEVALLPPDFIDTSMLEAEGIRLTKKEELQFRNDVLAWLLSQFLHGEQGALLAATQVTEAVPGHDAKLYGATQIFDEARHVEVFLRYLETKLEKKYEINDNLFTIIDALMSDGRWDMKFLGMQIMVEGLALGAFSMLYKMSEEPLLRQLLRRVIQDEARHVHFGVVSLRQHFKEELSEAERIEREDWALEVALLMRDRFLAGEVYEEWFEGRLPWTKWREIVERSPGLRTFRQTMFRRLVPNLREIGLLSPRVRARYDVAGLLGYARGAAADSLDDGALLNDLAAGPVT